MTISAADRYVYKEVEGGTWLPYPEGEPMSVTASLLKLFDAGDVDGATALIEQHPDAFRHTGYTAHPLLRDFVASQSGHCYKRRHLLISELLIPDAVRSFRDAVIDDRIDDVRKMLHADPDLISADFTAGRGIAQAIHHWQSSAMAELLLDAGADINALTTVHDGETPLALQVRFGSVEGVRLLLKRGADPNLRPRMHMPSETMTEILGLLIDHGWDIHQGHQLLHDANHGHGRRITIWLDHGVDPNASDDTGRTALHVLAERGTGREAIRALAKAGADIKHKDNNGNTPLDLARKAKSRAAESELIASGAKEDARP